MFGLEDDLHDEIDRLKKEVDNLKIDKLILKQSTYTHIEWPESQDYMEELWFEDEAILDTENGACYFIPTKYVKE